MQAMEAAATAGEAGAERRRLADEYLDVALYLYDQLCGRLHAALQQARAHPAGPSEGLPGGDAARAGASLDMPKPALAPREGGMFADEEEGGEEQALGEVAALAQSTLQVMIAQTTIMVEQR